MKRVSGLPVFLYPHFDGPFSCGPTCRDVSHESRWEMTDEKLVNAIWSVHLDDGGRMEYRFSRKDGKPVLEIYGDELSPSLAMMLGATFAK